VACVIACDDDVINCAKGFIDNAILSKYSPLYSIYSLQNVLL
jgi:hypothetical protein